MWPFIFIPEERWLKNITKAWLKLLLLTDCRRDYFVIWNLNPWAIQVQRTLWNFPRIIRLGCIVFQDSHCVCIFAEITKGKKMTRNPWGVLVWIWHEFWFYVWLFILSVFVFLIELPRILHWQCQMESIFSYYHFSVFCFNYTLKNSFNFVTESRENIFRTVLYGGSVYWVNFEVLSCLSIELIVSVGNWIEWSPYATWFLWILFYSSFVAEAKPRFL